ncbi:MAG: DUF4831 family protein [Bacteroidales bacterium]|jgi:hypothetical protein|nr:DUF4831 family protein [Bacteroidales bacterium]
MRRLGYTFAVTALLILITGCAQNRRISGTQVMVTPLAEKNYIPDGSLVYGLPLTVVDIAIETERIIEKPGPYFRYAEDMLGLRDVIRSESEAWLVKSVSVKTHQELDPSGFYVMQSEGIFLSNALALKNAGLILDINPEIYNGISSMHYADETGEDRFPVSDLGADEYFQVRRDTAYRLVNVDTAFIRIPYLVEKKQKLGTDQLAERAARRLMELRDGKHMILTGETNVFPQNDAAIKEMNRLEKEYTELFTGKSWSETQTFNYQIIPAKTMSGKKVSLGGFSEVTGPSQADNNSALPLNIEFVPENKTREIEVAAADPKAYKSSDYSRLFYRVPDVVNVKISLGDQNLSASRLLIYQFGTVVQLPANYIIGK